MQITLLPFQDVDPQALEQLAQDLEAFGLATRITPPVPLPAGAYNPQRDQYQAEAFLATAHAAEERHLLGVTACDLYVEGLNFVFGLAERPGKAAVISLHRLVTDVAAATGRSRILKEAVHELGHTFGLAHCRNPDCVMRFSNSLADTDRKGTGFCAICRRRLPVDLA